MINLKLSSILTTIAEILKFKPEEKKKVIDLSKSARTIRDYENDIFDAYSDGTLDYIQGLGPFSLELVKEYFEKSSIKLFDQIKEKYPEDLLRIVRLSGIGTKVVFDIYEKFNIKSFKDLKDLINMDCDKEKLTGNFENENLYLERIKHSVNYYESQNGVYPRWLVLKYAGKIIEKLSGISGISSLKITGSLRRRKSEVGDIDILVLPEFNNYGINLEKSKDLINEIRRSYFVKNLISKDIRNENISAKFSTIFDIDLEVIITSKISWPADLLTTTGSKSHLAKLKEIAKHKGCFDGHLLDFSQIKFKNLKKYKGKESLFEDDDFICPEEKQIYEFLELRYIVPELREGLDEVELARKNYLPNLIKLKDIKGDLHVHSNFSDGIIKIKEIIKKIKKYDYEYLSFSDHSSSNQYGNGLTKNRLVEKIRYIENLNLKYDKFRFLMGSEVEIDEEGNLDYDDGIINNLDIALGSMHKGFKLDSKHNNIRFEKAMKNKYIDIIGHPTGVVFKSRAPYFLNMDYLIECAYKYGKALEINSYYLRLDLNEENARKAKNAGVLISINTDSHRLNNLDMLRYGVDIARRAGIEKESVINTLPLEKLKKWKNSR
ncbi:MAG: PHP domain-containing protein [Actinomycetota bacterium]|nr:PHP domain-containing protein [Actinomycetota bacterium]